MRKIEEAISPDPDLLLETAPDRQMPSQTPFDPESDPVLSLVETRLHSEQSKHLSPLQRLLLQTVCSDQRLGYSEIALASGYSESYLKYDAGPKLWRLLGELFQEKVTKSNCRAVLERHCRIAALSSVPKTPAPQIPAPRTSALQTSAPQTSAPQTSAPQTMALQAAVDAANYLIAPPLDSPTAQPLIWSSTRSSVQPPGWRSATDWVGASLATDWGDAPEPVALVGRETALAQLQTWLLHQPCRLVAIAGIGGVGKTALAATLVGLIQTHNATVEQPFHGILWRSLRHAPSLQTLLANLHQGFGKFFPIDQLDGPEPAHLMQILKQQRWLIVLDQFEAVCGAARSGSEDYVELLRLVAETAHRSTLLITSRELPPLVAQAARLESGPLRLWSLSGLTPTQSQALLDTSAFGSEPDWQELTLRYGGNPAALTAAAATIASLYEGSIRSFLDEGSLCLGDLRRLWDQQLSGLSELEAELLDWLAIGCEPTTLADLKADLLRPQSGWLEAIESLLRRSLVEKATGRGPRSAALLSLNPAIGPYLVERFVDQIEQEILGLSLKRFHSHALIKAQSQDYLREIQTHLILRPLAERLQRRFQPLALERHLRAVLARLHETPTASYGAGNLLNLLCYLQIDLTGYDFSDLTVWQAYLQEVNLHGVNFAAADLSKSVFTRPMGGALSVAFSPDGSRLATSDINGTLRLWQVSDGKQVLTCQGYGSWVCLIAFSPDGRFLASASEDHQVKLWSASTGETLLSFAGHQSWVWAIAFSASGQFLASASEDHTIRIWSTRSGRCLKVLTGHNSWVCSVAFSPVGPYLVSAGDDQLLRLWNARTGLCLRTLWGHSSRISAVVFSPSGELIASASEDQTIRLWSAKTGDCLRILKGHSHWVWSIAFSPNGKTLISGSQDQTVKVWDVETGQSVQTLQGHSSWVQSVAFSPDGMTLASGSEDQTVRLWNVQTGRCLNTLRGYASWVQSVAFSPDGKLLASSSEDHKARLWQVATGDCVQILQGHESAVLSVAFSPDGEYLAGGGFDPVIRLWQIKTGECVTLFQGHGSWVRSLAFSPDGNILVSAGGDCYLKLWRVKTGECLQTLRGHSNWVWSVAFSPDGRYLASCGDDQTIQVWDALSGKSLQTLRDHGSSVTSVAWSPDGQHLVSSSADQTIKLWDRASGRCLQTLTGHTSSVFLVTFSPDGSYLASSSADQTIKLWDRANGACLQTFSGHTNLVFAVTFSPDGTLLASGSRDETIKLWDTERGCCWKTLRAERPYEKMNIAGSIGLTESQKITLKLLGAIE